MTMNSRTTAQHVEDAGIASAPDTAYLLSNELVGRLGVKGDEWWGGLTVTARSVEAGIDSWHALDPEGGSWLIRSARWNSAAACRLQLGAALALRLGEDLAEAPAFLGAPDSFALVYPHGMRRTLAEFARGGAGLAEFLALAVAVASALARLHAAGVVHGALVPARLLLDADMRVRFAEFEAGAGEGSGPGRDHATLRQELPYAAPELLRTDPAPADARADLYAIGVILYEQLTGALPLAADGLAGWLHAHVAMEAPSVRQRRPDVPPVLDALLLKLLSKDARARYQTAEALAADLRRVARALARNGQAETFPLARGEFADAAQVATRLFGRREESRALAEGYAAFRATAAPHVLLVSGPPGAGKSTLVETFLTELRGQRVICAAAKGVQLRQGAPLAPLRQALRRTLAQLMAGDATALTAAQARLARVSGCGRLLAELAPDLPFLPPDASAPRDVPAQLAQARLARIFIETFGALAAPATPVVLFFDDLQWFDHASLAVLRQLCDAPPAHVLVIGSYRTETRHRMNLRELLDAAGRAASAAPEVRLRPLTAHDTEELVAFTLKSTAEEVRGLAAIVHREAGGNPFHAGQLLQRLRDEGILRFDAERCEWVWDAERLGQPQGIPDLMNRRIDALSPLQRGLLQHCASLGGRCSADAAARLSGISVEQAASAAGALVAAGLLHRVGTDYAIVHDRVLEAAYARMTPEHRAREHLNNARLLGAGDIEADRNLALDIAAQIERCDLHGLSALDRARFARFVMVAARLCRSAGDAERALHCVDLIRRMAADPAEAGALPGFEVEWLRCDCLLALAQVEEALDALDALPALARDAFDLADIHRLRALGLTVKSAYPEAIEAALDGLRRLDIELDAAPTLQQLDARYRACRERLDAMGLDALLALPDMTDRRARAALALLSTLIASFFVEGELRFLHTISILELSLAHGLAPETAYGLAFFGMLSAQHYAAYQRGAELAAAATALAARDGYEAQRTATLIALDQVSAWTQPIRTALDHAREGARIGQAAGDVGMTCYARNHIASNLLILGERLDRLRAELVDSLAKTAEVGYADIEQILAAQLAFVDDLVSTDRPPVPAEPASHSSSVATRFWTEHYAGLRCFYRGDYDAAARHLTRADALAWAAAAHIDTAQSCFFLALARLRSLPAEAPLAARLDGLSEARARFAGWARLNPETFGGKHLLLEAEAARLEGRFESAAALFEQAAGAAGAAGFLHDQALAHELAAQLYLGARLVAPAQGCLRAAARGYRQWGAHGKAARLGAAPEPMDETDTRVAAPERMQNQLDLAVVRSASQALAEEIGLEQVVRTLMKSMVVHAGAQFGLLLLLRGGAPVIEAAAWVRHQTVEIELRPEAAPEQLMPSSVLQTVWRTGKPVTLADAALEAPDRGLSMGRSTIRSLACIPLLKRGELIGILYLENALAAEVFTPRRMAMLDVLAPQAAISLDAARLYGDLMEENLRRARAEFDLREARSELARTTQLTAMGSFTSAIAHEINQPLGSIVSYAEAALRWMNRAEPDFEEVRSNLLGIRNAGRRAADIIQALRALVKQAPSSLAPLRIESVVEEVLTLLAPEIAAAGVTLATALAPESRAVLADRVQLQQVMFNLVTNALHAMADPAREPRTLSITTTTTGDRVEVTVEDSGCGMAPDLLGRIFQPFFTTKATGMGVGLAICRSIVELHGGTLDARSVEGEGSAFRIRLPFHADAAG
jgi:signal transduction histidine kinase/predicted ATPase